MKNVFILGLDDFNRDELESLRCMNDVEFHALLSYEQVVEPAPEGYRFNLLLDEARADLDAFAGSVDAIITLFDFPSTALATLLRQERGLRGPSNQAVARCEHKYWSRLEQRKVAPEVVPPFAAVDPRREAAHSQVTLDYPYWIKPVQSHSSQLGFAVDSAEELNEHLQYIGQHIARLGRPFDAYLSHLELPEDVGRIGGHWCVVEGIISDGAQCTIEGYVHNGKIVCYGVVDSIRTGRRNSSFSRYQYPSHLPKTVQQRMIDVTARVLRQFQYDNAPFNIEFFWNEQRDQLWLLEVNARISKSHCPLFRMVDGVSHQQVAVDLALGREPLLSPGKGNFQTAAKFMMRENEDGIVVKTPTESEISQVRSFFPDARIKPSVRPGDRLSERQFEDSYSYSLADIFLGAQAEDELLKKYDACAKLLQFEVKNTKEHNRHK